jgi:hypothetical protein
MNDQHLDESAELYALGGLGELERARAERHLRTCDECAVRVGRAEAAVLRMIESDAGDAPAIATRALPFTTKPRAWTAALVAAALVAGLLPFGLTTALTSMQNERVQSERQSALTAMLSGHFSHAPFISREAGAPAAKVVYAREGGWVYVIAAPGKDALTITVTRGTLQSSAGSLAPDAGVRSAFIPVAGRVDSVDLVQAGRTIASAHLVYPLH